MQNKTGASGRKWPSKPPAQSGMTVRSVKADGLKALAVGRPKIAIAIVHEKPLTAQRACLTTHQPRPVTDACPKQPRGLGSEPPMNLHVIDVNGRMKKMLKTEPLNNLLCVRSGRIGHKPALAL